MKTIVVVDYDPQWPVVFEELRARIWPAVRQFARSIEHVGSTAVPGLAAKSVIDMSIVLRDPEDVAKAVQGLATLGYEHRGDLGIEGREAFAGPLDLPRHHLYACPDGSLGLTNHLVVRDYLRMHPKDAAEYGALKKRLAREHPNDMDAYIDGKTDFILSILRKSDAPVASREIDRIETANRKAP